MANFRNICADKYNSFTRIESNPTNEHQLFRSREARKPIQSFRKYLVANNEKASPCPSHRFNAIITKAVRSFANSSGADRDPRKRNLHDPDNKSGKKGGVARHEKYAKGGTLPQDSAQELKRLLSIAPINLLRSCSIFFKTKAAASGVDAKSILFVQVSVSEQSRLRNDTMKQTTCFKMPSNSRFYIAFTVHAL